MAEGILAGIAFVEILPDFKKFANEAQAEVRKAAAGAESEANASFSNLGKIASTAVLGAAVVIGAAAIDMADKFEVQHARLTTALTNIGDNFEAQRPHVAALDKSMQSLGFTNADVEGNLSTLVGATHNTGEAIKDMALAADIARGRHIDLASATQLLVKVETGHIALLGRLGINVKDANGQIITQEEAIKRLTALYGGQGAAYAETFAGKMQVLKATSEDLAKNLGLRLIPIIETLASDSLKTVQYFEDNHAAAIALGVVIGGPLVAAMLTYLAAQSAVLAGNVVDFFGGIANAALIALPVISESATALAGLAGVGPAAAGAGLATGAGLGTLAVGAGVAAVGLGAVVGGLVAYVHWTDESDKHDKDWAHNFVTNAAKTADASKAIGDERAKLSRQMAAQKRDDDGTWATTAYHLDALNKEWKRYQETVSKASADAAKDHAAASAAIVGDAGDAGQAATAEGKAMVKALTDLTDQVGPTLAALDQAKNYSLDQIKAITEGSKQLDSGMTKSFNSATSVVDHFKDQATIDFREVNKFLADQVVAARNWASNLKTLAADGIDGGLLQQLSEAGPKAAPLVKALLDDVKAGNLQAINQSQGDLRRILGDTEGVIQGYEQDYYATGYNLGAALANGAQAAAAKGLSGIAEIGTRGGTLQTGSSGPPHTKPIPLAAGGFVDRPTLAMVGEKSRREVILPLEDRARAMELLAQSGLFDEQRTSSAAPSLGGGFGGSMVEALMRDLIAAVKNGHEVTVDGRTLAVVGSQGLASRRRSRS